MKSSADLSKYRSKRDPERTPEPFGGVDASPCVDRSSGAFVVQQHAARRMHWDLRLEIDGALSSWAVPRGPSLDPSVKRLAVRTEDHPLEYSGFEGVIPPGNYGAGAMIVWDRGTFHTVGGQALRQGLAAGKLDLVFYGHKLQGRWALVRLQNEGGRNWLLFHKGNADPRADLVSDFPASILSGLRVDELASGVTYDVRLREEARAFGAVESHASFASWKPMLASPAASPFTDPHWIFELKYDGARVLARRGVGDAGELRYRSGGDATAALPEIADAVGRLPCRDFVVDGEVVALDDDGQPSFERLQSRLRSTDPAEIARGQRQCPVLFLCFDLLRVAGLDCRALPLLARKKLLAELVPRVGVVRYADHVEGRGEALYREATARGLEGIVAKRADSIYQCGKRSPEWRKIKAARTADLVVIGYTRGRNERAGLGALMLAWRRDQGLRYAGNVGSGLRAHLLGELRRRLAPLIRKTSACADAPRSGSPTWLRPEVVAEVRYAEITSRGLLRQPIFLGLREDKNPLDADVLPPSQAEASAVYPAPPPPQPQSALRITRRDKLFWPEDGFTKGDLLDYYEAIWPRLAPYLEDRPVVLTRYPDGIYGKSFFQRNAPSFTPAWVTTRRIDDTDYFLCNELRVLLYVINSGCIPLHVWSARAGSLDRPDWAILDLDPKGAPFASLWAVARSVHDLALRLKAPHYLKTSGQEGLHVLFPLGGALTHAEARSFVELFARAVAAEHSEIATVARPRSARAGRVYLDYLQNGYGKTIAAPFSVRPRLGAPVSTPITWRELVPDLDPRRFNITTVPTRFARRHDPLAPVLTEGLDVLSVLSRLRERLE